MVPMSEENGESSDGGESDSTIQYVSQRGTVIDGQPFNWKLNAITSIEVTITDAIHEKKDTAHEHARGRARKQRPLNACTMPSHLLRLQSLMQVS